jgi:hypothetical protein
MTNARSRPKSFAIANINVWNRLNAPSARWWAIGRAECPYRVDALGGSAPLLPCHLGGRMANRAEFGLWKIGWEGEKADRETLRQRNRVRPQTWSFCFPLLLIHPSVCLSQQPFNREGGQRAVAGDDADAQR